MFGLETFQAQSSIARLKPADITYVERDSFIGYTNANMTSVFNLKFASSGAKYGR